MSRYGGSIWGERPKQNKFKSGDKVMYKDGDMRIFRVYAVYNKNEVSLGLYDYPDTEQDYLVNIKNIVKIKG